ncbi:hypothetical protein Y032_0010g884 [Ancylostoma ceylanicum]|uniref:Uncharacterized protein n=1 Tax=Ancylostoma ceylanicum TaxID=53326 RepID=A0A016VI08_9BILA|nr:hypothetical protein Y032_0010g884 [Ancylostoma ceylanicum]
MSHSSFLGVQGIFAFSYSVQNSIHKNFHYCQIRFPFMILNSQASENMCGVFSKPNFHSGYMKTVYGFLV